MNDDTPAWIFGLALVFGAGFLLWQAHHFKMNVLDLILGAKPVVVVNK